MHSLAWIGMVLGLALAAAPAQEPECRFVDTFFAQRHLGDYGYHCGYLLLFYSLDDPFSMQAIEDLRQGQERFFQKEQVLPVAVNINEMDSMHDVALDAMRRGSAFPHVKPLDECLQQTYGVTSPGDCAVLDTQLRPLFIGRITQANDAIEACRNGATGGANVGTPRPVVQRDGAEGSITYSEDIAPLIRQNCMPCHGATPSAPFSLLGYADAAQRSAMMAEVVTTGAMPPWPEHGSGIPFTNAPRLTQEERLKFLWWHESGAAEGPPMDAPAVEESIFSPDITLSAVAPVQIPPEGFSNYVHVVLPYVPQEDLWVQALRIAPSNPRVVHHAVMQLNDDLGEGRRIIAFAAPGQQSLVFPDGVATLIPRGQTLSLTIHYEPTGKPEEDLVSLELTFPRGTIQKRARHKLLQRSDFMLPAEAPRVELSVGASMEDPLNVLAIMPHKHLRGKMVSLVESAPFGFKRTLLSVPAWRFDWQLVYYVAPDTITIPAGSKLKLTCTYDNSVQNPYNPEPLDNVQQGLLTRNEMMECIVIGVNPTEELNVNAEPERYKAALVRDDSIGSTTVMQ